MNVRSKPCGRNKRKNERADGTQSHTEVKSICLRTFVEARKKKKKRESQVEKFPVTKGTDLVF